MMAKPIIIKQDKCIGCQSCAAACSMFKTGSIRPRASGVVVFIDQFNKEEKPVICRQCKKPKCLAACSTKSLFLDPNGVVVVNVEKCNGCYDCVEACPFNAIHKDTTRNVVVKCDLCKGEAMRRCIAICPVAALS